MASTVGRRGSVRPPVSSRSCSRQRLRSPSLVLVCRLGCRSAGVLCSPGTSRSPSGSRRVRRRGCGQSRHRVSTFTTRAARTSELPGRSSCCLGPVPCDARSSPRSCRLAGLRPLPRSSVCSSRFCSPGRATYLRRARRRSESRLLRRPSWPYRRCGSSASRGRRMPAGVGNGSRSPRLRSSSPARP